MLSEQEEEARANLEKRTRERWLKELRAANKELKRLGEDWRTDAEVEEIAKNTHMRVIYPMMYSSYKLNGIHFDKDPESAARALKVLISLYW